MSVAPRWMTLFSCVLCAAALRHAGAQSLVIYDDALENGFAIKVLITPHDSIGVDRPEDVELVEEILRTQA